MDLTQEQLPLTSFFSRALATKGKTAARSKKAKKENTAASSSKKRKADADQTDGGTTKRPRGTFDADDYPNRKDGSSKDNTADAQLKQEPEADTVDLTLSPRRTNTAHRAQVRASWPRRPQPTAIQPLPTPRTANPPRLRRLSRAGATSSPPSPPGPTPRPRGALRKAVASLDAAAGPPATAAQVPHLPTPTTGIRPRPRPRNGARLDSIVLPNDAQDTDVGSRGRRMSPPTSPVRAAGSRHALSMRVPGPLRRSPKLPVFATSAEDPHRATSPLSMDEDDDNPFARPRQQPREIVSQTVIPTSQIFERTLSGPFSPPRASTSAVTLSPKTRRKWGRARSGTVVQSSQMFENSFKRSPARRGLATPKTSQLQRPIHVGKVLSPTVVPGTPSPMKIAHPASRKRKHPVPTIGDDDDIISPFANPFMDALVGEGDVPLVADGIVPSSQSQSEDEFKEELRGAEEAAAFIPTSQTQMERDLVTATPSAFRRIAKGRQSIASRVGKGVKATGAREQRTPSKRQTPKRLTPAKYLTPKTHRCLFFPTTPQGAVSTPTGSIFDLYTSPPRMLSSSSQSQPRSDDSEVDRMLRSMPSPLRAFKDMFDEERASISPRSMRLAVMAEEDSVTEDEDEALPVVHSPAARQRHGRSISRSPRKVHGLRALPAPSPVRASRSDDGALEGLPAGFSFSQSGASLEEGAERVETMEAVRGFLEMFDGATDGEGSWPADFPLELR